MDLTKPLGGGEEYKMEKTGLALEQKSCSYDGKEYPLGYVMCRTNCRCIICRSGTWEERTRRR